jgi:pyrroline-5-carboxylate reductase
MAKPIPRNQIGIIICGNMGGHIIREVANESYPYQVSKNQIVIEEFKRFSQAYSFLKTLEKDIRVFI